MFYGALLLTGANLVLRLAGMSFQVYLSGRVGAVGVGLLQLVLSVRMLAFTVGSAGARTCALYSPPRPWGGGGTSARLAGCVWYCSSFPCPRGGIGPSRPGLPALDWGHRRGGGPPGLRPVSAVGC